MINGDFTLFDFFVSDIKSKNTNIFVNVLKGLIIYDYYKLGADFEDFCEIAKGIPFSEIPDRYIFNEINGEKIFTVPFDSKKFIRDVKCSYTKNNFLSLKDVEDFYNEMFNRFENSEFKIDA